MAASLLPGVAGPGDPVFEENGEAGYYIRSATPAQIGAVSEKIRVLGGDVALVLKQLAD